MIFGLGNGRIYIYRQWVDMRKGAEGLSGLIRNETQQNPRSGDLFVFFSRNRSRIRLLRWEGDGFGMYSKILEVGTYEIPAGAGNWLNEELLYLLLKGVKLDKIQYRKRYQHVM